MAINPPSDIINDVARAADPTRYQAAAQRLVEGASAAEGGSFEDAVKAASMKPLMASGADIYSIRNSIRNDAESATAVKAKQAHQEFEAFILQTFVESMLPKDAENTYGKGTAGSIWKSMMAEQIGAQISRAGGIGVAQHILGSRKAEVSPGEVNPSVARSILNNVSTDKL
jgi:flagellar protein FlgJ